MSAVLVADRAALFGGAWPQGYLPLGDQAATELLDLALRSSRFEDRPTAEANPAWKQWIPYCVLRCAPGPFPARTTAECGILLVQRIRGTTEQRLHGAYSIGLGGHVDAEDGGGSPAHARDFFARALQRELREELDLGDGPLPEPKLVGLINDDSTEVGTVHAGLAYVLDLPMPLSVARGRVRVREISKLRGGFTHLVGLRELWLNRSQFESWSQLLLAAGIAGDIGGSDATFAATQG